MSKWSRSYLFLLRRLSNHGSALALVVGVATVCALTAQSALRENKIRFASLRQEHSSIHKAGVKIIDRDFDDLLTQLENSINAKTDLKGRFEISPSVRGLTATHTSAPAVPIDIQMSGSGAFTQSLRLSSRVGFYIFTEAGTFISQATKHDADPETLFQLATLARRPTQAQTLNLNDRFQPVPASQFSSRWSNHLPRYIFSSTRIQGTNLILVSLVDTKAAGLGAPLQAGKLALIVLFFALLFVPMFLLRVRSRKRSLAWLESAIKGMHFGCFESPTLPNELVAQDREVVEKIQELFEKHSPLSMFYSGKWINPDLRLATWWNFRENLRIWALNLKRGSEIQIGRHWFAARMDVSDPMLLDRVIRIFGRAFAAHGYMFYQSGPKSILLTARADDFDMWREHVCACMKALIDSNGLSPQDLRFAGYLVNGDLSLHQNELNDLLNALTHEQVSKDIDLNTSVVRLYDFESRELLARMNWIQTVAFQSPMLRRLTIVDQAMASAPTPQMHAPTLRSTTLKSMLPPLPNGKKLPKLPARAPSTRP